MRSAYRHAGEQVGHAVSRCEAGTKRRHPKRGASDADASILIGPGGSMSKLFEDSPFKDGLPNDVAVRLHRLFINRWFEIMLADMDKDLERMDDLDFLNQLIVRARWSKQVDLLTAGHDTMKRYGTPQGELELVAQIFGDQLGLAAGAIPPDVAGRLEWYKKRIAAEYERQVRKDVNFHQITSPIEQIFLMEWRYHNADERYGVKIRPQKALAVEGANYTIDFVIEAPGRKIAIELDGHDFHEKTHTQAMKDRARERSIVRHGYTILRFTGTEIARNPRKCVEEVVALFQTNQ